MKPRFSLHRHVYTCSEGSGPPTTDPHRPTAVIRCTHAGEVVPFSLRSHHAPREKAAAKAH